jgi:hypothetical protein
MGEENDGDAPREQLTEPKDAAQLRAWVERELKLKLPREAVCQHHQSPFEYLDCAFFQKARDIVVWAPRGGGKTRLGAAATLLDLLFKPQCHVRILGGSLDQSLRMWEHLGPDVHRLAEAQVQRSRSTRRIDFENGSSAAILPQSQRAVRGLHVQKLRCDEVEMFDPEVWQAAQLIARSKGDVKGTVEVFSTMHKHGGLMSKIVDNAERTGAKIIKWCILDVMEKCPEERVCKGCALEEECNGIAKTKCDGFVPIDDVIAWKRRVDKETWESEMLCRRPSTRESVFGAFDHEIHVVQQAPLEGDREVWLGIDFGFAAPFVCLWVAAYGEGFFVLDEYVQEQQTMDVHIEVMRRRQHGYAHIVACDPAGSAKNEQTAKSNVDALMEAGYTVKRRRSFILEGVERIRSALRPADGTPRLFVHPRCKRLIAAMKAYRYREGGGEVPLKDGEHDHLIDALRYFIMNYPEPGAVTCSRY